MQIKVPTITACMMFTDQAEEAARFYVSVFKGAQLGRISHYGRAGTEIHGRAPGTVLTAEFSIGELMFVALNGPRSPFTEAISFQLHCDTQEEIDYYWDKLGAGGEEGPCGWLKDRFGVSWQVMPSVIPAMMTNGDQAKADRVMQTFMQMKKLDLARIERAYAGEP
jgi:predicted 3-demethylubiquinone-9 3-methyltransferase (glyoxalase superfamily)